MDMDRVFIYTTSINAVWLFSKIICWIPVKITWYIYIELLEEFVKIGLVELWATVQYIQTVYFIVIKHKLLQTNSNKYLLQLYLFQHILLSPYGTYSWH